MKTQISICVIMALSILFAVLKSSAQSKNNISASKSPHYPGGQDSLAAFLQKNLRWPEPEIDVQGRVILQFTVTKTGRIVHPKVFKKLYKSFDEEALRIVKLMPRWVPANHNGKLIDKVYYLPINFMLSSE